MENNSKLFAAAVAAATDVEPAAAPAAAPTDRVYLSREMAEIGASRFEFAPPVKGVRGTLGLFDEDGGMLEFWTCSKTITEKLTAISSDASLTKEQKEVKAHRYACTLVLMWVTAQNGDVVRMLGESRDFSNGFSF